MQKSYTITLTQLLAEFQKQFDQTHLCPTIIHRIRRELGDKEVFIDDDETIFQKLFMICPALFDEAFVMQIESGDVLESAVRDLKMFSNFRDMRQFRIDVLEMMIGMVGDATLTFRIVDTVEFDYDENWFN